MNNSPSRISTNSGNSSTSNSSHSAWEHIHCCVCYRDYISDNTRLAANEAQRFWLTSCSHVICENDMFPGGAPPRPERTSHSCPCCKSESVKILELVPELPPTVAPYFRSIPQSLEEMAAAHTFQFEHMSQLIRYLKQQTLKQKEVLVRVKGELLAARELKRSYEDLKRENEQLKAQLGQNAQPSGQGVGREDFHFHSPRRKRNGRSRSPDGIPTPRSNGSANVLPPRLTLPGELQSPAEGVSMMQGSSRQAPSPSRGGVQHLHSIDEANARPGTARSLMQYAYNPSRPGTRQSDAYNQPGSVAQAQAGPSSRPMGPPQMSRSAYADQHSHGKESVTSNDSGIQQMPFPPSRAGRPIAMPIPPSTPFTFGSHAPSPFRPLVPSTSKQQDGVAATLHRPMTNNTPSTPSRTSTPASFATPHRVMGASLNGTSQPRWGGAAQSDPGAVPGTPNRSRFQPVQTSNASNFMHAGNKQ